MGEKKSGCLPAYITQIKEKVAELSSRHRAFLKTEPLIAFRGESNDYGDTKLTPSLFRDSSYVAKESHLFELFCDYNIVDPKASNIEKAIETQHYASISRMLDISFDVLVALYFACTHPDEHDGYVYVFAFPEHYSPHSKYIEEFYTNVLEGKHIAYSRNFKVFSHSVTNDRIKAQKGGFIFFPGKEFHPINDCYYERILISKNHKREILEDLEALFQITKATLFPEKDKVAEIITNKFKGNIYTTKSVSLENEIESFFSRIDYELKILHLKGKTADKKRVMRWLRKEQDDLINYTEQQISSHISELTDAEQEKVIQTIKNNFNVLLIRYKEV